MRNGANGLGMLGAALLAGLIAIIANTLVLEASDWIPLVTARGGLLKLLKLYLAGPLTDLGVPDLWAALSFPAPDSHAFSSGFHIFVGLLMALFLRPHGVFRVAGALLRAFHAPPGFGILEQPMQEMAERLSCRRRSARP